MSNGRTIGVQPVGTPFAATAGRVERRARPRRTAALPVVFASTFAVPRGESGTGVVDGVSDAGCIGWFSRPLDPGQWVVLSIAPGPRDADGRALGAEGRTQVRARILRSLATDPEADAADHAAHPFAYALAFSTGTRTAILAGIDRALPWIGIVLIVATAANVVWLRGNNLYYFWYHPIINLYGLLISGYILSRVAIACAYRPPADVGWLPPITVAISCKNEEDSIYRTVEAIYRAGYPGDRLEVIAVDDGSTDGTWAEMQRAQETWSALQLIRFDENRGKRHGMAAAARRATGEIVVYVDSDSFVQPGSLRKIAQGFADPDVGAICGHARVENASQNFLTKMQEVRYYVAFRIVKAAESIFSTVTCCSGCLAAYRRSYLMPFIDVWLGQTFLGKPATFGDDRSLTNLTLRRFRVIYDSEAVCSTIVPATLLQFFRQQLRWKKSWIRESLLASAFMWRRHPLAAFFFYLGVVFPLVSPAVVFVALVLPLAGVGAFSYLYLYGTTLMALLYGLLYLVRYKTSLWFWGLAFSIFYMLVLVWQTYYALLTVRRNHWGTR